MQTNEARKLNAYAIGFAYRLGQLCAAGKFKLANDVFNEHKVKGEFTSVSSGTPSSEQKFLNDTSYLKKLYGEELPGNLKGTAAVRALQKAEHGCVKNAFYRKSIGHIDLFWGDKNKSGLAHIIERRKKTRQPVNEVLGNIEKVITQGTIKPQGNSRDYDRYNIEMKIGRKKYRVVVTKYCRNDTEPNSAHFVVSAMIITNE